MASAANDLIKTIIIFGENKYFASIIDCWLDINACCHASTRQAYIFQYWLVYYNAYNEAGTVSHVADIR